jgi:hypothetical protein
VTSARVIRQDDLPWSQIAAPTVLIEILDNVPGAGPGGGPGQCCVTIAPDFIRLDCPC